MWSELGLGRIWEIYKTAFRSHFNDARYHLQPLRHLAFVRCLQETVSTIFCVEPERVRPLVVDELRDLGSHDGLLLDAKSSLEGVRV